MILAVNLGVCPDYCYGNLRHLFAYNNILWEYHSPRETRHPNTQNLKAPGVYGIFFFLFRSPCLALLSTELRAWAEPHNNVWKVESASGTQTIAGIKYEQRVKDSDQCKYCRHKSYLSNIFIKTSPSPHPGRVSILISTTWNLPRCLLQSGMRTRRKYCINPINTSITCNPNTALCLYSYSATTAKFPPIRAQWGPRDLELHQSEVKPEADWFTTIISFLGQLGDEHYILHL